MARTTPPDRLEKLIAVAASTFIEHGFHHTQMDDIAVGLGVSKGTVYRSVDSKESLLAAVLSYADTPELLPAGGPIKTADLEDVSSNLRKQLARSVAGLALTAAVATRGTNSCPIGSEVEHLAADLFQMMAAHRVRIMVLDRCAVEVPTLGGEWYESGRYAVVDLWSEYLEQSAGQFESTPHHDALARTIVEIITLWSVKMPWDPAPRPYPLAMAAPCALMIRHLVTGASS